jgi:alanine-glyoxylate transaminase/serine-glyoxylate transaminase/serine-pyruvate transaminase
MLTVEKNRIAPPKRLIYGPGPTMVEPRAYEAMGQPLTGIRDPYFLSLISEIREGLREAFGTKNERTYMLPASGSGAMEAAVANFVVPDSKLAVFSAGHFADRIAAMGRRQRADVSVCEKTWGEIFTEREALAFIDQVRPDIVAFVQGETSTGAYQSGGAITEAAHKAGALVIADCVTTLGAMPVEVDAVGIDVAYSCSQKGLGCPAGLSPITISPAGWEWLEKRPVDTFTWYLDLRLLAKYFEPPHQYHHTPSPPLYYALHQGLAVIEEEGLEHRWERHQNAGRLLISGLRKLGFEPLVKTEGERIWHVSTVLPPAEVNEAKLRERLMDNYNIEIAGGLGKLAGKVLRIGTMGPLATGESVDFLLAAIAASLQ